MGHLLQAKRTIEKTIFQWAEARSRHLHARSFEPILGRFGEGLGRIGEGLGRIWALKIRRAACSARRVRAHGTYFDLIYLILVP